MMYLRLATDVDLPLIMAWRSSPLVYQGNYQQKEPLSWEEHINWYKGRNKDWREFIIEAIEGDVTRPIGVITIGQLDHWSPEIGYLIGEIKLWGKGIATEAVNLALNWLSEHGYKYCHTTVKKDNKASLRVLEKLGFKYLGEAREGESWYQKRL